tara:strand:+ start:236 stop:472 length:237 start_codon:yes stop_codon:yes gene_type:complete
MANKLRLKKSSSAGSAPTVHGTDPDNNNDLMTGEVALNYRDGKIYYAKTSDGTNYVVKYFPDVDNAQADATALAIALG